MPSSERFSCAAWRLYVIIDRAACGARDLADVAQGAIRGGADVLQLRDKAASSEALIESARRLLALTRAAGLPLIINDRVEVARAVGADGVHLGQDDTSVESARACLGPTCLIGKSTHRVEQALAAQTQDVDYIGLGPIFPTPTKPTYGHIGPETIALVVPMSRVPVVCIGGLNEQTLSSVLERGAVCVAVVRAVCSASEPYEATRACKRLVIEYHNRAGPQPKL